MSGDLRLATAADLCVCGHLYDPHYIVKGPFACPEGDCKCEEAKRAEVVVLPRHHVAAYDGKLVAIDYVNDRKREYNIAAMRICDNDFDGYVITPRGEVFEVLRSKRTSRKLGGDERDAVVRKLGLAGGATR